MRNFTFLTMALISLCLEVSAHEPSINLDLIQCQTKMAKIEYESMSALLDHQDELLLLEKEIRKASTKQTFLEYVSKESGKEQDILSAILMIERDFKNLSLEKRKVLQLVLKARGMYHSSIDGAWGKSTRIAFATYLAPLMDQGNAQSTAELFREVLSGFYVPSLWLQEDYEQEIKKIYQSSQKIITIEPVIDTNNSSFRSYEPFTFSGVTSSGTWYRQTGSNIFGSDGSSYRKVGKNLFGSDGTNCRQVGNNLFCN